MPPTTQHKFKKNSHNPCRFIRNADENPKVEKSFNILRMKM